MSARTKLKRALKAIEEAQSRLTVAQNNAEHAPHYARIASKDLEDAVSQINGALKEIPHEG